MKWVLKSLGQKALDIVPYGQTINDFVRDAFFSKKTAYNDPGEFNWKTGIARAHLQNCVKYGSRKPQDSIFYEFGAGWDLAIPISYSFLGGVKRQLLIDAKKIVNPDFVNAIIDRFNAELNLEKSRVSGSPDDCLKDLREFYGIEYSAPRDAADTGIESETVDFISSTHVLEHIPERDIPNIFRECRRILKLGGIFSCEIDAGDHYSYFDKSITTENFLKFGDLAWRLINSKIHYQNRLRRSDYIRMFEASGFELLADESRKPRAENVEKLRKMKIDRRFWDYPLEELAVEKANLVLRKTI